MTVLVSDDAEVIRRAIRCLFADFPEIEVVGEPEDFSQTIQLTNDLRPRVTVMDLAVPTILQLAAQKSRAAKMWDV